MKAREVAWCIIGFPVVMALLLIVGVVAIPLACLIKALDESFP